MIVLTKFEHVLQVKFWSDPEAYWSDPEAPDEAPTRGSPRGSARRGSTEVLPEVLYRLSPNYTGSMSAR